MKILKFPDLAVLPESKLKAAKKSYLAFQYNKTMKILDIPEDFHYLHMHIFRLIMFRLDYMRLKNAGYLSTAEICKQAFQDRLRKIIAPKYLVI